MTLVSDVLDALLTIAQAAGAEVDPPYTDVEIGAPMPRGRCVRVWWTGEVIPAPQMDGVRYSLDHELVGQGFAVTAFEPMSGFDEAPAAARMNRLATFVDEFRSGVNEDRTLGGKAMSIEPEATPVDYANLGGTLFAFAPTELTAGLVEYPIGGGS